MLTRAQLKSSPWLLFAAILGWYLISYVFLPVPPVRRSVDESWRAFLTWAFEHRLQFGVDVVFTYGPWGFLLEPRGTLSAYPWQIAGRLLLAVAASAGIVFLGSAWIPAQRSRLRWTAALVLLADLAALAPVLLFLVTLRSLATARGRNGVLALLVAATGLAACTKFTIFLLVAALLPVLALRAQRAVAPAVVAAFAVFWLAAGQDLANVPRFALASFEVARGYATAMVANQALFELPVALGLCILPLVWWYRYAPASSAWDRLVRLGWLTCAAFLHFRHAMIRSDSEHTFSAMLLAAAPVAILLAALPGTATVAQRSLYTKRLAFLLIAAIAASGYSVIGRTLLYGQHLAEYPKLFASASATTTSETESVDVFPSDLAYAIRAGLPLRNRPVIQAYSAYSPKLAAMNAAFLEGPSAPDIVYFHAGAIDEHFPTLEDSLAWRSLLTHYLPDGSRDGFLLLRHRDQPATPHLTLLSKNEVPVGQPFHMPGATKLVWAQLTLRKTLTGKLLDTFYRGEKMRLHVHTSHRTLDLTLLDETASGGFLLSPYIDSPDAMQRLYTAPDAGETVLGFTVQGGALASLAFARTYSLELYSLDLPSSPGTARLESQLR